MVTQPLRESARKAVDGASVIEIERISKRFRSAEGAEVTALDEVSLKISAGRFTTLLGPSGCGKTTLLRAIAGFEDPDAGRILLGGADITRTPPFERPVNTVFQHYALFPHLSVEENVAYGLEVTGVARSTIRPRVAEALELVRLGGLGNRRIAQLSGGQQQRVALARSLVLQPEVLLLDEPMAALDRNLRKEMQVELKRLQNEVKIAFLCVTHDQEEALSMSDTVVVMNRGRVEQIGSPRDIYERPASRFVAGFVGDAALIDGTVTGADASGAALALADGSVIQTRKADLAAGSPATAVLRPDRLTLLADGREAPHVLTGQVRSAIYLGDKIRLDADVAGCGVVVLCNGAAEVPAAGATVRLAYDPADVQVVTQ
ncbi:ABC transporter ATP-binding protein [Pleomorphomonas sp. JP5]|uniref:ABC transporter ATP-binding protein n=1 Tax=Pleomorphomonas sp. JP5 TaxID=2942998 RepID=UPI002043D510|nr:ABC transporter ATP-binding protein [Pleomorphomonas sp. JP5]MCM5557718.1 ABC transporter ATP-binding protein [Pleomorphomonas sp. JP5]